MDMPKLMPLPIRTRQENGKPISFWKRVWRWLTSIRQWEVIEDWEYKLPGTEPTIVVPSGFVFDGASIPRPLWGILSPTGSLLIPGLVHDFAYRYDYLWALDPTGVARKYKVDAGRKVWDPLFRDIGLAVNGIAIIDWVAWRMLVGFGGFAWRSNRDRWHGPVYPSRTVRASAS